MASEHMWGCGWGRISRRLATRLDRIARRVGGKGCGFTCCEPTPGRPQFWFFGPNRGEPFDSRLATEVQAAAETDGITFPLRTA